MRHRGSSDTQVQRVTIELVALALIGVVVRIEKAAFDAVHLVAQLMTLVHEARIGIDLPAFKPLKPIADCLDAPRCLVISIERNWTEAPVVLVFMRKTILGEI